MFVANSHPMEGEEVEGSQQARTIQMLEERPGACDDDLVEAHEVQQLQEQLAYEIHVS
jgi:hypothetical protein